MPGAHPHGCAPPSGPTPNAHWLRSKSLLAPNAQPMQSWRSSGQKRETPKRAAANHHATTVSTTERGDLAALWRSNDSQDDPMSGEPQEMNLDSPPNNRPAMMCPFALADRPTKPTTKQQRSFSEEPTSKAVRPRRHQARMSGQTVHNTTDKQGSNPHARCSTMGGAAGEAWRRSIPTTPTPQLRNATPDTRHAHAHDYLHACAQRLRKSFERARSLRIRRHSTS